MIKIHVAELLGSITPCINDLQAAMDEAAFDTKYENALADLRALDAESADLSDILEKINHVAQIDKDKAVHQSVIDRLDELMQACEAALQNKMEFLIVPADLAVALAPYRETAIERTLDAVIAVTGGISALTEEQSREELLAELKIRATA